MDKVIWEWIGNKVTNSKGYSYGRIKVYMSDGQGGYIWKAKKKKTGFWPRYHSTNESLHIMRVNEEMAHALMTKRFSHPQRLDDGTFQKVYFGRASDGQKVKIIVDFNNELDFVTIHPVEII